MLAAQQACICVQTSDPMTNFELYRDQVVIVIHSTSPMLLSFERFVCFMPTSDRIRLWLMAIPTDREDQWILVERGVLIPRHMYLSGTRPMFHLCVLTPLELTLDVGMDGHRATSVRVVLSLVAFACSTVIVHLTDGCPLGPIP